MLLFSNGMYRLGSRLCGGSDRATVSARPDDAGFAAGADCPQAVTRARPPPVARTRRNCLRDVDGICPLLGYRVWDLPAASPVGPSAPPQLKGGVQTLEFDAGIGGREAPVDGTGECVPVGLPG